MDLGGLLYIYFNGNQSNITARYQNMDASASDPNAKPDMTYTIVEGTANYAGEATISHNGKTGTSGTLTITYDEVADKYTLEAEVTFNDGTTSKFAANGFSM